jgi:hypothetical protein
LSPLHNRNALELAIKNSSSIKGILSYLGLSTSGDAYKQVRKWAETHELDIPKYYRPAFKSRTLEDRLQKGLRTKSSKLLVDLVAAGLKQQACEECGQGNIWNGKPLTLHLDHIDGDHDNNLLENLRVLCPHCHQQTPTFGAKNMKSKPARKYFCACGQEKSTRDKKACQDCSLNTKEQRKIKNRIAQSNNINNNSYGIYLCVCGQGRSRTAKQCKDCYLEARKTVINLTEKTWPPVEDVLMWLEMSSFVAVGKKIGVSDNAVRKFIKRSGHEVPKRYNMAAK